MSKYAASPEKPFHLSVGAVIYNEDFSKILVHHIAEVGHVKDIYVLMRESLNEDEEDLTKTLERGAMEEFGAKVKILNFIGSIQATDEWFGEINKPTSVQKTTLYFVCSLVSQNKDDRIDDGSVEGNSKLEWHTPSDLIKKFEAQFEKYKVNTINEAEVVKRAEEYLVNNKLQK